MSQSAPYSQAVSFSDWIDEIRPQLQPPVGNKLLFGAGQHKVMVVGGPNVRSDYHIEMGEEIFYQLEGGMAIEVYEKGQPRRIEVPEGQFFLLPGRIPHSPQRKAGTVGLVIERERNADEIDGLRYYMRDGSGKVLYEEWFQFFDLGVQLKPVIERFFASEAHRTGIPNEEYGPPLVNLDEERALGDPIVLADWIETRRPSGAAPAADGAVATTVGAGDSSNNNNCLVLSGADDALEARWRDTEYYVRIFLGPSASYSEGHSTNSTSTSASAEGAAVPEPGFVPNPAGCEVFFYQLKYASLADATASTVVEVYDPADAAAGIKQQTLSAGDVLLVKAGCSTRCAFGAGGSCMVVINKTAPAPK